MQDGIHPQYREVVFRDEGADFQFVTRSTIRTNQKITVDGKEYPLVYVDISSASHPFFTGKQRFVDSMGRIEKFNKKFGGSMLDRVKNLKKAKGGEQPS